MLRKFFIYLFVLALVWQSGCIALQKVIQIRQHKQAVKIQIKNALREGLHDQKLVLFTETELQNAEWEHSKEFFLKGEKYDVVKKQVTSKETIFYCIPDKREMDLYKALEHQNEQHNLIYEWLQKVNLKLDHFAIRFENTTQDLNLYGVYLASNYRFDYSDSIIKPPCCFI